MKTRIASCTLRIAGGDYLAFAKVSLTQGGIVSFRTGVRSAGRIFLLVLIFTTLIGSFQAVPGIAQDGLERKVKSKIDPLYPEIARRMGLTGVVKLQLVVAANGTVKETKVIGGHPILVNAAVDAVKKWKFEAGSAESTGTVEFKFDPGS
jgi:TonB family protein